MSRFAPVVAALLSSSLLGCQAPDGGAQRSALHAAVDVVDVADHECRVVLRRADPVGAAAGGGLAVLVDGADTLLAAPGASAGVLARADGASAWSALDAAPAAAAAGAPAGFHRFL